jgi:hypothetical protein
MARAAQCVLVFNLLVSPVQLGAQEAYLIRPTKAGPGAVLLVEKQDKQRKHLLVTDGAGKTVKDQEDEQSDLVVYREKILAQPAGEDRPTHMLRQFQRAERRAGGRVQIIPLEGKTYDIEKKDGRYRFAYVGGEVIPAEAEQALEREFNSGWHEALDWEKFILPPRPVRVHDAWNLDMGRAIQILGNLTRMRIDANQSSGRAQLTRIYEQDRHRFAEVNAAIVLATTGVVQGTTTRPLQPGSRISLLLKINGCIDGSAEVTTVDVRMEMNTSALSNAKDSPPGMVKVQLESSIHEQRREEPGR